MRLKSLSVSKPFIVHIILRTTNRRNINDYHYQSQHYSTISFTPDKTIRKKPYLRKFEVQLNISIKTTIIAINNAQRRTSKKLTVKLVRYF